jgi:hypothetical protein
MFQEAAFVKELSVKSLTYVTGNEGHFVSPIGFSRDCRAFGTIEA